MESQGNTLVLVIAAALLVALGTYLFFRSRGQSRSIRRFAESRGLVYRADDQEQLEQRVNDCVALDGSDLTRTFSQFGDVVSLGYATLFRAVELLDLTPWGRSEYVNKSRVAVTFSFHSDLSGIFLVLPGFSVHQRYPPLPVHADEVKSLLENARVPEPPCPLSLTIMRGRVVAYLEPLVTGSVPRAHLDYLAELPSGLAGPRG